MAEASDGQMAIEAVRELRPNVIMMDMNMPTMNGLEATRRITSEFPEIAVIGLSMNDDEKVIVAMREAGATGYVSKTEAADKLVDIIEAARSAKRKEERLRPLA